MPSYILLARNDGYLDAPTGGIAAIHVAAHSCDSRSDICDVEIHAYVDEFLDGDRMRAVEAHIERHPAKAAMVKAYLAQREALRAMPEVDHPMPDVLAKLCERWKHRFAHKSTSRKRLAAAG